MPQVVSFGKNIWACHLFKPILLSAMNLVFITYEEKGNTKAHQDKCN